MSRMRVGVIGCGLIGQMMHLPHLKELHDLFDLVALCDVSPGTLKYVGRVLRRQQAFHEPPRIS